MLSRRGLATAVTGLLTLALVLGTTLPASAHSALTGSNPADGSTITAPLDEIQLTYSEAPLTGLDSGLRIEVRGPDGADLSTGEVRVSGTTMSKTMRLHQPGRHTVLWRYVSADGHPIDGQLGFLYQPASAAPGDSATPEAASAPPARIAPTSTPHASSNTAFIAVSSAIVAAWVIGILGVVLAAIAVSVILTARRRARHGQALDK